MVTLIHACELGLFWSQYLSGYLLYFEDKILLEQKIARVTDKRLISHSICISDTYIPNSRN